MTERPLLAMLHDAMESLLAATHGGIPQRVEGVIHSILQQCHTQHILRNVQEIGIECPEVETLLIGVADMKSMPGNSMHNLTSAIMLNRIFRAFTASENTCVGRPPAPLQTPVGDPAIEYSVDHGSMHTGGDMSCELEHSSVDATGIFPRQACQSIIWNIMPPSQFVPYTLVGVRFYGILDGYHGHPLELGLNFHDIIVIDVPNIFACDLTEYVNGIDAHTTHFLNLVDKIRAVVILIPGFVICQPIHVVRLNHTSLEQMHPLENIISAETPKVTAMYTFPAEVACKGRNPELGCIC